MRLLPVAMGSFVSLLFILSGILSAQADSHPAAVQEKITALLTASPALASGHLGFKFVDAENGTVLAEQNADQFFTPASTTKLYTTALALVRLGQTYRFRTVVRTSQALTNGQTVVPDLIFVAGGDPNLSGRVLPFSPTASENEPLTVIRQLADQIAGKNIKQVNGDISADDTRYPFDPYPDGWSVDDTLWYYGAPVSAFAVNDSSIRIIIRPTGEGELADVQMQPEVGHFVLLNQAVTDETSTSKIKFFRLPGSNELVVSGTIGRSSPDVQEDIAVMEPALFAAQTLKFALEEHGIAVLGEASVSHRDIAGVGDALRVPRSVSSEPGTILAALDSAPLSQVIQVVNKASQNLHAEMLLRETAWATHNLGTLAAGLDERKDFLAGIGIPETTWAFVDGSGLARQGLTTPTATVSLLEWMWKQPERDVWLRSLAIGGVDGTLRDRFKTLEGADRIHAKTGSLSHVSALSGYLQTRSGRWITFSLLANAEVNAAPALETLIEQICAVFLNL